MVWMLFILTCVSHSYVDVQSLYFYYFATANNATTNSLIHWALYIVALLMWGFNKYGQSAFQKCYDYPYFFPGILFEYIFSCTPTSSGLEHFLALASQMGDKWWIIVTFANC